MPNILKRFLKPTAVPYEFLDTDELVMETEADLTAPSGADLPEGQEAPKAPKEEPKPKTPMEYAQLQAVAIMDDAHRQAEALLEQAKADIAEELERIREGSRQEGFRAGYTEGMTHAMEETQQQRETQAKELAEEVGRFLEKAAHAREELLRESQDELRDLAISVAEKIVRVSLKSSSDVIGRMILAATEKLKRKEWVHIYVAGCDTKRLAETTPHLTAALAALSDHVKIVPMADDESGTCIIEMPDEIIDASATTQMSNIRDLLIDRQS